jgi:hypothetical protein
VAIASLCPRVARADATVTSHSLTSTSFTASGTCTSPYVTIYADDPATASWWTIVPVVNGSYTGTVTFPEASDCTTFKLEVWGSLNDCYCDSGYWDKGAYFERNEKIPPCPVIPALDLAGLAILAVLLGLAGWFAIRRVAP